MLSILLQNVRQVIICIKEKNIHILLNIIIGIDINIFVTTGVVLNVTKIVLCSSSNKNVDIKLTCNNLVTINCE